jgi:hypothetical protein
VKDKHNLEHEEADKNKLIQGKTTAIAPDGVVVPSKTVEEEKVDHDKKQKENLEILNNQIFPSD